MRTICYNASHLIFFAFFFLVWGEGVVQRLDHQVKYTYFFLAGTVGKFVTGSVKEKFVTGSEKEYGACRGLEEG